WRADPRAGRGRRRGRERRELWRWRSACGPLVQGDDAAAEQTPGDLVEAGLVEQLREAFRWRKPPYARGQVRVGRAAGEHLSGQGDDSVEPQAVERLEEPTRPRDLEDREAASRLENTPEFGEPALEIVEVADSEAHRRCVERLVRERHPRRIAGDPVDVWILLASAREHRLGE